MLSLTAKSVLLIALLFCIATKQSNYQAINMYQYKRYCIIIIQAGSSNEKKKKGGGEGKQCHISFLQLQTCCLLLKCSAYVELYIICSNLSCATAVTNVSNLD